MDDHEFKNLKIAIVGPCSSGKSTLRKSLHSVGYTHIKNPTQEHSYVPDMWQKISKPDILIYLDVDYPATLERRPHIDLGPNRVKHQSDRLAHARQHADLYIDTSQLNPQEIELQVVDFLDQLKSP
ncbi:MAG: hypothetical protein AAF633_23290 [Chloroflexota bacterium]